MDSIRIIKQKISRQEVQKVAKERFGDMVKGVVDVEKGVLAIGGELHADEEALLLEQGSSQQDLWGINLYLEKSDKEWIEFDSVINLRPSQGNRSRGIDDPSLRQKITQIIQSLII